MHRFLRALVAPSLLAASGLTVGCREQPPTAEVSQSPTLRSTAIGADRVKPLEQPRIDVAVRTAQFSGPAPQARIVDLNGFDEQAERTALVRQPSDDLPPMSLSYGGLQAASQVPPADDSQLQTRRSQYAGAPESPALGAPELNAPLVTPAADPTQPTVPSRPSPELAQQPAMQLLPAMPPAANTNPPASGEFDVRAEVPLAVFNTARPATRTVDPAAIAAVSQQAQQRVDEAFALARRGAMFAARAELIQALRMVAQAVDTLEGGNQRTQALASAMQAMQEAEDFYTTSANLEHDLNVAETIRSHTTPVLKNTTVEQMSSLTALQQYYGYAQQQFAIAAGGTPVGSRALYALAKVHMTLARSSTDHRSHQTPKAMALLQASLQSDARNHLAANELGVLLAQYGQWPEARRVLLHSVTVQSHAEGWQNLAVVHAQLGEHELAKLAQNERQLVVARQAKPTAAGNLPMVQWVSPQELAASGSGAEVMPANVSATRNASSTSRSAPSSASRTRR